MYIKKEDYNYFMGLFNGLDEAKQQAFMNNLKKTGREIVGEDISRIKIIDDSIYDVQAIDPSEMITRTMIKKAFKVAEEGK